MSKTKKTEIIKLENKIEDRENNSVENFISQAISQSLPVETLERLFDLRIKVKAEKAKEAFDSAMAKFQGECPVIEKSKNGGATKSGKVAYKYAPLDSIVSQVKSFITNNEFSYKTNSETFADKVKVTVIVKHSLGHSEDTSVEVPLGTKTDIMSAPQVVASALTFAKRYAFCNAFGIMTGDEDNDATEEKKNTKIDELKAKVDEINNIDELRKFYVENRGNGAEFDTYITNKAVSLK